MAVIHTLQNKATLRHRFETAAGEYLYGDIMPLVIAPEEYQQNKVHNLAWDMTRHIDPSNAVFENAQFLIVSHMKQALLSARHYFDSNMATDAIRKEFRDAMTCMIEDIADRVVQNRNRENRISFKL